VNSIRSFVAVELPNKVSQALATIIADLRSSISDSQVKWVKPQNIHLTLKFLGDISTESIPSISESISAASAGHPSFCLFLKDSGAFPNMRSPRVIWTGLDGDMERLRVLQHQIDKELHELGFPEEKKDYRAHLTLGRVRDRLPKKDIDSIAAALRSQKAPEEIRFNVTRLSLMKSTLTPQGPVYEVLRDFCLTETRTP